MATLDGYYTKTTGLFAFADDNQTTHLYNNMFNGTPVDYIEVFVNEGSQLNYGGSLQLNLKHAAGNIFFNSYASVSYTNGERKNENGATDYSTKLSFIAPFMFRIGTDVKFGRFTCSPRLLLMGRQNLPGIADTTGSTINVQTISGYALLNIAARFKVTKRISVFTNVTNALNQRYRAVGFNMDLNRNPTELFHGQPQEPIRFVGGVNFEL
jgi:outer membrane receptor protein involved in Fe transport